MNRSKRQAQRDNSAKIGFVVVLIVCIILAYIACYYQDAGASVIQSPLLKSTTTDQIEPVLATDTILAGINKITGSHPFFVIGNDTVYVGSAAADKDVIVFFNNSGDSGAIQYNGTDNQMEYSNDGGSTWNAIGSGGSVDLEAVFNYMHPDYVDTTGKNDSIYIIFADSAGHVDTAAAELAAALNAHDDLYDNFSELSGTASDAQVPNDITIDAATYADSAGAVDTANVTLETYLVNVIDTSDVDYSDDVDTSGTEIAAALADRLPLAGGTMTGSIIGTDSLDLDSGLYISDDITITGTVDGVDVSALNADIAADSASWNAAADNNDSSYYTLAVTNTFMISTGAAFTFGAVGWSSGDNINGEAVGDNTIDEDAIDWGAGTDQVGMGDILDGFDTSQVVDTAQALDVIADNAVLAKSRDTVNIVIGSDSIHTASAIFWNPDLLTDTLPIFYCDSTKYPYGVEITSLECQTSVDGAYALKFFSFTAADPPVLHDYIDTLNVGVSDQRVSSETFEDTNAKTVDIGQIIYILTPDTDIDWVRWSISFIRKRS